MQQWNFCKNVNWLSKPQNTSFHRIEALIRSPRKAERKKTVGSTLTSDTIVPYALLKCDLLVNVSYYCYAHIIHNFLILSLSKRNGNWELKKKKNLTSLSSLRPRCLPVLHSMGGPWHMKQAPPLCNNLQLFLWVLNSILSMQYIQC